MPYVIGLYVLKFEPTKTRKADAFGEKSQSGELGANQDSFSPGPAALPSAGLLCTTHCIDLNLPGDKSIGFITPEKDQSRFSSWESSLGGGPRLEVR